MGDEEGERGIGKAVEEGKSERRDIYINNY